MPEEAKKVEEKMARAEADLRATGEALKHQVVMELEAKVGQSKNRAEKEFEAGVAEGLMAVGEVKLVK